MDDDEQSLDLFKMVFSVAQKEKPAPVSNDSQFNVTFCDRSIDAVNHVKESISEGNPFAAAFLDIRMEGQEDGIWVGQKLRAMDPDIELVFVTGYSGYNPNEIARLIPPVHKMIYVQKPFGVHEILHLAHALVHKWKTEKNDREIRERLSDLVEERTRELKLTNDKLEKMVQERTEHLEEANIALKVLLKQREGDKKE